MRISLRRISCLFISVVRVEFMDDELKAICVISAFLIAFAVLLVMSLIMLKV